MAHTVVFPAALQGVRDLLGELVAILEQGRTDAWYAFVTADEFLEKRVTVSTTESLSTSFDRGLVMRIVAGGQNFEYATNNFDPAALRSAAKEFRALVEKARPDPAAPVFKPLGWRQEDLNTLDPLMRGQLPRELTPATQVHFSTPYEISPDETTLEWMVKRARDLRAAVVDYNQSAGGARLAAVNARSRQKIHTKMFVDRCKNMSQSILTSLTVVVGVSPKGMPARVVQGGMGGFEAAQITQKDIQYAAAMPLKLDNAKRLKAGRYKIISGPDVTGVFAHEAFGHTQEGDTRMLGRSCATALQREKTTVGNEHATIYNNAGVFKMEGENWGSNGSHFFDDEGQLARPHRILDRGVVTTPMNNLLSSLIGDENGRFPRQSNGRRESWRRPIMARQTNTYFTGGDKTLDELIQMVNYGFLAEMAYGGMEDPKGMGLTCGAQYLEEIKNGKLTGEIFIGPKGGHVELSDPVPRLLQGILAKSKVGAEVYPCNKWGGCAKYHKESIEAGCGGPHILWEGINCG